MACARRNTRIFLGRDSRDSIRASHCLRADVTLRVDKTSPSGYIKEREA